MFKLENYITPLLLSYVDKYIKNFRPEDSQVSLWGGDASFHNLDLRLEVLEEELHLPFSFVSGHIHELLIHVPWTKLASEPITITINTIECILKVRTSEENNDEAAQKREQIKKSISKREEVETPPGYVQSLINKIVSNIKIFCNNLILKYVEEDIVVSMNVKLLTFESANEKWEPSYTDVSSGHVILRKLITVSDLTICIDKRNAAGKIDVYQEPVLYRCSLVVHIFRNYHTATIKRQSVTRVDVYCNSMEFSMTEQQVPMLMRIIVLMYALQQKQLSPQVCADTKSTTLTLESSDALENSESWAGWAWSFVPSIFPVSWDEEWNQDQEESSTGHTLHTGFYVDYASLTFKVSEPTERSGYYSQRKIKYLPLLTMRLQGIVVESIAHGLKWFNCKVGISQIVLLPVSQCCCGHVEMYDGSTPSEYLKAGLLSMAHKMDSLFDPQAVENKGLNRAYSMSWDYHMITVTESSLLECTPGLAIDYLYHVDTPEEMTNESLSELGTDLEYSNLNEKSLLRVVLGPLRLRLCSGFFHRIGSLRVAAAAYDYQSYRTPKPEPAFSELPPPCAEDYDALLENIPTRGVQITVLAPIIELQVMDHPIFEPSKRNLYCKRRKQSTSASLPVINQYYQGLPKITIESQCVDAKIQNPMYTRRLVHTVCQLPDSPQHMFDACYSQKSVKIIGLCSRLVTSVKKQTTIVSRCNASYTSKSIIKPQYWLNCDIPHEEITIESENVTLTTTKAKLMLVMYILEKLYQLDGQDTMNYLLHTTIIQDASRSIGMTYLELSLDELRFKKVITNSTVTIDSSLGSIKAFIYEPIIETVESDTESSFGNLNVHSTKEIQQVLIVSGPEYARSREEKLVLPLCTVMVQYPLNPNHQPHPSIIKFCLEETRICVDPLLCRWLLYSTREVVKSDYIDPMQRKNYNISEASGSVLETPRRAGTPHESIHSSSDREHLFLGSSNQRLLLESSDFDLQAWLYTFLTEWSSVWNSVIISVDIAQCIVYFPMQSLSSANAQGMDEAVERTLKKLNPPEMIVITLPTVTSSSALQKHNFAKYLTALPVKLPHILWNNKSSLPWSISLTDISCYTLQNGAKLNFLKPFSLNATIGISTKVDDKQSPCKDDSYNAVTNLNDSGEPLGICIHVDMSPIDLSVSEVQICLIASILYGLTEVICNLLPNFSNDYASKSPDVLQTVVGWSSSVSPTVLRESTADSVSEKTPSSSAVPVVTDDNVKLTAWIQWTITRFKVTLLSHNIKKTLIADDSYLYTPNLKLVLDAEDIVSSLDFQSVYLKIKTKIAAVNVQHFKRKLDTKTWVPGKYLGIIMKIREVEATRERQEDVGFATITITRASSQHTHALWGTVPKSKAKEGKAVAGNTLHFNTPSSYITEVVITTQPIDLLLSLSTLRCYYMAMEPLMRTTTTPDEMKSTNYMHFINNQSLPLLYVECRGLRVIIPSNELHNCGAEQNVFMLQISNISLTPSAVNPICRNPCRPDIYQLAAQSRILNIPGSEVEDRQYQLDIKHLLVTSGVWEDFCHILNIRETNLSSLRTMNQNPALEWNKLGKGRLSISSHIGSFWTAFNKFDVSIIIAPAMIYKKNTLICGHSVEINCESDVEISLSLAQIKLILALVSELTTVIQPYLLDDPKRPYVTFPYARFDHTALDMIETDYDVNEVADSGFETSEFQSTFSLKSKEVQDSALKEVKQLLKNREIEKVVFPRPPNTIPPSYHNVPIDVLITGGKVMVSLYEVNGHLSRKSAVKMKDGKYKSQLVDLDKGYEASEEGSIDEKPTLKENRFSPLLFVSLSQPNAFVSRYYLGRKVHLSCFDVGVKISDSEYTYSPTIPVESDYAISILETLSGMPDPGTGIRPAFFMLKWSRGLGQPATVDVEFARPTRILCSTQRWGYLFAVKDKILGMYKSFDESNKPWDKSSCSEYTLNSQKTPETYTKFRSITDTFFKVSHININFAQIVLVGKTGDGPEVTLGLNKLRNNLTISKRPERLLNVTLLEAVTLGVFEDGVTRSLLNPWTVSVELNLSWESWQSVDSNPLMQVSIESDCIMVDVSPEQINCVKTVIKDLAEFVSNLSYGDGESDSGDISNLFKSAALDKEQFYKDDLRAGAFQFVDSATDNVNELPLPYQVMFWKKRILAMAWRYPQPRTLTKVRVFPAPFKITTTGEQDYQILCHLEYWSECHNCYRPYLQFYLSESDANNLSLPENNLQYVASIWRVVLSLQKDSTQTFNFDGSKFTISPRVLAACMRIDSYFNKNLVPDLSVVFDISTVNISLYSDYDKSGKTMPPALKQYTCDMLFPERICFGTVVFENIKAYLCTWNFNSAAFDVTTSIKSNVLDYSSLTQQSFIDPFALKLEINLATTTSVNFMCRPIKIRFGPSIAHTLTVSAQLWQQSWVANNSHESQELIIATRYVICNNTNVNIKFGQTSTDENILLLPQYCHFYCWRSQKTKQMLRVGLEENDWLWSRAFPIDKEGVETYQMSSNGSVVLIVTVKNLSVTQKQVTFSGQLVVCNMLLEHFELKVVLSGDADKEKEFKRASSHIVPGKSCPPTLLLNNSYQYHLRLRFFGLESAWSGDIPLKENSKCTQPWLVKVPLQERGQFLSIWCRIVTQPLSIGNQILAILWPLFMIRSNLPVNSKVHISTPTLNVNLESTIRGRGECQQLYCPGTIDHSHQLSFQLENGEMPTSNPYVPLNYSLVDQKDFFKRKENEDIGETLSALSKFDSTSWPYFGEDLQGVNWVQDDQPLTYVQVRYENACEYSSALLVELLPWSLLINTLGCPVAIVINEREVCRISHNGIVTPPKLEETFHIAISINGNWNISSPLQVATSEWSSSFYMPKITGTIPLEGDIKTAIICNKHICVVSIASKFENDIRLLKISSSHVLTNNTTHQLHILCFAVPDTEKECKVTKSVEKYLFTLAPNLDNSNLGTSIIQWCLIGTNPDTQSNFALYISISINLEYGWSCPVRVDKDLIRRNVAIQTENQSIPIVITAQNHKGQTFLSLYNDLYPQMLIENRSEAKLFFAQAAKIDPIISECQHFQWTCFVENSRACYYTMPGYGEKFPEISQENNIEQLSISCESPDDCFYWSNPINLNEYRDHLVSIPAYGDVKISITKTIHTLLVVINSTNQVEINAKDIRVRLFMHESETNLNKESTQTVDLVQLPQTSSDHSLQESSNSSNDVPSSSYLSSKVSTLYGFQTLAPLHEVSVTRMSASKQYPSDVNVLNTTSLLTCMVPVNDACELFKVNVLVKEITLTFISDLSNITSEMNELANFTLDNIAVTATQTQSMIIDFSISEIQFDNQLYSRGNYDFPVVLIGQETKPRQELASLNTPILQWIKTAKTDPLLKIEFNVETWKDLNNSHTVSKLRDVRVEIQPVVIFIEDDYIMFLKDYISLFSLTKLVVRPTRKPKINTSLTSLMIEIPSSVQLESLTIARPLTLCALRIEPISLLLSVHWSVKLYIALDQSPLQFGLFERSNLLTTSYRLGNHLAMHYITGAIFGAGWVVGSLELLGTPGGLAREMGIGLRDFINLPYQGFLDGPWAFLQGVTYGSASLMRHVTAGTLQSVTKLASSVARNLDRLTLDEEHLRRTEEQRRHRPQGVAEGFMQGLTGLGISLLGAVGGIAHHPLQSVLEDGASPASFVTGVGLGLMGIIAKPLSGAADLVALTGQGLLQGAGWCLSPAARNQSVMYNIYSNPNSLAKYTWKFLESISQKKLLFVTDATWITGDRQYEAVTLILTTTHLVIINSEKDECHRIVTLTELLPVDNITDPTLLNLRLMPSIPSSKPKDECLVEMDPACRARVADYVRNTVGVLHFPDDTSPDASEMGVSPCPSPTSIVDATKKESLLSFYVNPQNRNYFLTILTLAKHQLQNYSFPIL
ncbi:hypothetical protein RN001_011484 [Aquatica leii]|uniref:Vacuolar protein sorting-associated protein 13B n=1 Tax=Aquatica leii TaxID=1421715 RepID=A0AAN7PT04_9COLE|nr:hypothetical protein RN001_011484 [Aquatica leii]